MEGWNVFFGGGDDEWDAYGTVGSTDIISSRPMDMDRRRGKLTRVRNGTGAVIRAPSLVVC